MGGSSHSMNGAGSKVVAAEVANLAYYEANAEKYAKQTCHADLSHLYAAFLSLLPRNARILDVGCGGGRDLRAFHERGFDVFGVDPSSALVEIAREYSGAEVAVAKVEALEFEEKFDGVWACASLLHLPKAELPEALRRIHRSLIAGGVFFLSVQAGRGEEFSEDGRFYARYEEPEIRSAIQEIGFDTLNTWTTSDALSGRAKISWINLLARKPLPIVSDANDL